MLSFENEELSLEEIMKSFLRCLFEYSTYRGLSYCSIVDFLDHMNVRL